MTGFADGWLLKPMFRYNYFNIKTVNPPEDGEGIIWLNTMKKVIKYALKGFCNSHLVDDIHN